MKMTCIAVILAIVFLATGAAAKDDYDDLFRRFFDDHRTEVEKIADDRAAMRDYVLAQKDVTTRYKDNKTLLHFSANVGYLDVTALLLEKGADINAQDKDGRTPLHEAMSYNRFDVVRLLLDNGANVNLKNKDNETPLISIVYMDNKKRAVELVNLFLQKGFDVKGSARLLDEAIGRRHRESALLLIEKGAPFDDNAIVSAARMGYDDVFAVLLSKGANPQQKGIVAAALDAGNMNIIRTLIDKGERPTAKEVDYAAYKGHADAARYLKELLKKTTGQDVDIRKRCDLKPDPGICKALFYRGYYTLGTCREFIYGGCGGEVPFESVQACRNICLDKPQAR